MADFVVAEQPHFIQGEQPKPSEILSTCVIISKMHVKAYSSVHYVVMVCKPDHE